MKPGGLALTFHLHPGWNPEKQIQRDFTESTVAKKYDLMHWMVFAVMSINQSINKMIIYIRKWVLCSCSLFMLAHKLTSYHIGIVLESVSYIQVMNYVSAAVVGVAPGHGGTDRAHL